VEKVSGGGSVLVNDKEKADLELISGTYESEGICKDAGKRMEDENNRAKTVD
jgi:hypothetical protein